MERNADLPMEPYDNLILADQTDDVEEDDSELEPEGNRWFYSISRLRFILMIFACINLFGFPTRFGSIVQMVCGFVSPAFFLLTGFLILRDLNERRERIIRLIKRAALCFAILIVVYTVASWAYGKILNVNAFAALSEKNVWFNFFVLNEWPLPVGMPIWYVQALLYGCVLLLVLDRLKLLRFDWIIMLLCLALSVVSGELSKVVGFEFMGRTYLPGCFLTRALPYLLMGGFIARKIDFFARFSPVVYILCIIIGLATTFLEIVWLLNSGNMNYYGHFAGMILMAPSVCMLPILMPESGFNSITMDSFSNIAYDWIYYLCPIVGAALSTYFEIRVKEMESMTGLLTFAVCLVIVLLASFPFIRAERLHGNFAEEPDDDDEDTP